MTSENLDDAAWWGYRTRSLEIERRIVGDNPHIDFAELDSHGYLLADVTPERVQADWYFVDQVHGPSTEVRFGDSHEVRRGEHRLRRVGKPITTSP